MPQFEQLTMTCCIECYGVLALRVCRRKVCVRYRKLEHRFLSAIHVHAFLELCCSSDSELAAVVVEHSVVIRVTSFKDLQLTNTRPALHCLSAFFRAALA